jgi:6-phosphogluconolactonase
VASGEFPYDIAVSPRGTSAYAVDNLSATAGAVSQYTISPATGKLTPKSPAMVATAGAPSGLIAISPDGKNAYVPSGKAISQYRISPATGKLTPMPPRKVAGAGFPIGIKVAPGGRYLYFVSSIQCLVPKGSKGSKCTDSARARKASTVSVFGISPVTGALSARPVQTMRTGLGPQMISIAPGGRSAYVAATGASTIWQYSINPATGKLTPKSPAMVASGLGPHDLAVAPDGKNLYVITVGDDTIAQYAINPRTGALSARPVSAARTVPVPEAIALSPDGKNAYVTSEGKGALSQFAISPVTGKITPPCHRPPSRRLPTARSAWRSPPDAGPGREGHRPAATHFTGARPRSRGCTGMSSMNARPGSRARGSVRMAQSGPKTSALPGAADHSSGERS